MEHDNGLGQVYLSCAPLGTYDRAAALAACRAYLASGGGTGCVDVVSVGSACKGTAITSVGGLPTGLTGTWDYAGPFPGRVMLMGGGWGCPKATSPAWD